MASSRAAPWRDWDEWNAVGKKLFSADAAECRWGIDRVSAWRVRGRLPLGVDATAQLRAAQLADESGACEDLLLRQLFALPIARLVSGVADSAQRGRTALPVASLAARAGLPRALVDLRHETSHNDLPSLAALKVGAAQALGWLAASYWARQLRGARGAGESEGEGAPAGAGGAGDPRAGGPGGEDAGTGRLDPPGGEAGPAAGLGEPASVEAADGQVALLGPAPPPPVTLAGAAEARLRPALGRLVSAYLRGEREAARAAARDRASTAEAGSDGDSEDGGRGGGRRGAQRPAGTAPAEAPWDPAKAKAEREADRAELALLAPPWATAALARALAGLEAPGGGRDAAGGAGEARAARALLAALAASRPALPALALAEAGAELAERVARPREGRGLARPLLAALLDDVGRVAEARRRGKRRRGAPPRAGRPLWEPSPGQLAALASRLALEAERVAAVRAMNELRGGGAGAEEAARAEAELRAAAGLCARAARPPGGGGPAPPAAALDSLPGAAPLSPGGGRATAAATAEPPPPPPSVDDLAARLAFLEEAAGADEPPSPSPPGRSPPAGPSAPAAAAAASSGGRPPASPHRGPPRWRRVGCWPGAALGLLPDALDPNGRAAHLDPDPVRS